MKPKNKYKKEDLERPVTLGMLFEYTEDFLLPKISDMMDQRFQENNAIISKAFQRVEDRFDLIDKRFDLIDKRFEQVDKRFGKLEYDLKVYIDDKLADYTSDIFIRLDKRYKKDKQFKEKVVEILKKNKVGSSEELAYLDGLVQGDDRA